MKLPPDLPGSDLVQALHKLGYSGTRCTAIIFDSPRMNVVSLT